MRQTATSKMKFLTIGLLIGLLIGFITGYFIALNLQPSRSSEQEITAYSYTCVGDRDQLIASWSYAVDGDWSTKLQWNTSDLSDFSIAIIENFSIPDLAKTVKWEFKAYHERTASLMPTPMEVSFWNGSSWKILYALDDQEHVNEAFVETLNVPAESISEGKVCIQVSMKYSSHVVGGIPPSVPEQMWQYVEYYEGKLTITSA